jgi:hypothetical protein
MSATFSKSGIAATCFLLASCSKGGDGPAPPAPPAPPGLVSGASPFSAGCGNASSGALYLHSEVEPHIAVNPTNPNNLIGVWQQDRWSNGSAQGLVAATSFDGGATWTRRGMPFSRCGGGTPANGGDFERATDPWITFAADGTAYAMSLSTSGGLYQPGSASAMLVSRSTDGGSAWSPSIALIRDTAPYFNDKNTITADPSDARYVYAVWDRLAQSGGGPAYFARTSNGGTTWEPARPIHDPGVNAQTIGNLIVVTPAGALINVFTLIEEAPDLTLRAYVTAVRSVDRGTTWSAPIRIAEMLSVGARDPETGAAIRDGSIIPQAAAGPDGSLAVVWQDARFSAGARDAIAFSRSTDGGATWSTPARVNSNSLVAAFTPSVHVRDDGMIGVSYYDLRENTTDRATLPTGYFLARSPNGVEWSETRLSEAFDLATAPVAQGLFLGDYQGLKSLGSSFLAFFARTTGSLANRTDIFALRVSGNATSSLSEVPPSLGAIRKTEERMTRYSAETVEFLVPNPEHRRRVSENLARRLHRPPASAESRRPGLASNRNPYRNRTRGVLR